MANVTKNIDSKNEDDFENIMDFSEEFNEDELRTVKVGRRPIESYQWENEDGLDSFGEEFNDD